MPVPGGAVDLPWDYPRPFVVPVVPEATDIDGLRHTNNAIYVNWCEMAGWAHSEALGLSVADYQRLNRAMVIRKAEYEYLLPSLLGQQLALGTWITASDGKLTMERRFQLIRVADHTVILRGRWELVCVELDSGRPRRLPEVFAAVYLPVLVAAARG